MADMHVLTGNGGTYRVALHFAVPAGNNSAGIAWSDALVNSGIGGTTELPDGDGTGGTIGATEKAAVQAGTIFERIPELRIESSGTSGAKVQSALREFYTTEKENVQAELQRRLRYFGAIESEA